MTEHHGGLFFEIKNTKDIINENIDTVILNIGFIGDPILVNKLKKNDNKHSKSLFVRYYYLINDFYFNANDYYPKNDKYIYDIISFKFNFYYFTNNIDIDKYNIDILVYCINLCEFEKKFIDDELTKFKKYNIYLFVNINPKNNPNKSWDPYYLSQKKITWDIIEKKDKTNMTGYNISEYSFIIKNINLNIYVSHLYNKINRRLSKKKTVFLMGTHLNSQSIINELPDDIIWKITNFI